MVIATGKSRERRKLVVYNRGIKTGYAGASQREEDAFKYTAPCPICEKRIFDISTLPVNRIMLRFKCPHCHNVVIMPLMAASGQCDNNSQPLTIRGAIS